MTELTLVIPSLLGPLPNLDFKNDLGFELPRLPALELLLARAVKQGVAAHGFEQLLVTLFEMDVEQVPVAAITAIVDGLSAVNDSASQRRWMRIDPVHLKPDLAQLILYGERMLEIRQQEADAIINSLNELYQDKGWYFHAPSPGRWYWSAEPDHCLELTTTPLRSVLGRDIDRFLPTGKDALEWHRVMNEIQMLLHTHPVNQARMEQGMPAINSVWAWGEGLLPRHIHAQWEGGWSSEPVSMGLCRLANTDHYTVPVGVEQWLEQNPQGRQLVVLDGAWRDWMYGDLQGWSEQIQEIEARWLKPLLEAIRGKVLSSLTLQPVNGISYSIRPNSLRRFWRRTLAWQQYLKAVR